jgi:hypothetical protein
MEGILVSARGAVWLSPQLRDPGYSEARMRTIALPWQTWRAVIAVQREKGLPPVLEHANVIEEQLQRGNLRPSPRWWLIRGCVACLIATLCGISGVSAQEWGRHP